MFDKIKEKIKKWWGKFLVIIGIGAITVLATTIGSEELPSIAQEKILEAYNNAPEIAQEYILENTKFIKEAKDINSIQIEIGNDTNEFTPDFKISRWEDEVWFKIKLRGLDKITKNDKEVVLEGKKIKFKMPKKEIHLYDLGVSEEHPEGAYEYEVILLKKPDSNVIIFDIETQGLNFFYQPELTQEEIDDGAYRPENVVGSYAVYHFTKANHILGQKNYKVGKAFHIYRPKITDEEGNWAWEELKIENGLLTITIPQEFLDKAVYPISSKGLTFGNEGEGGSDFNCGDRFCGYLATGLVGTGVNIKAFVKLNLSGSSRSKSNLYKDSDDTSETNGSTEEKTLTNVAYEWVTYNFSIVPTLSVIDYIITIWGERIDSTHYPKMAYDSGVGAEGFFNNTVYSGGNFESPTAWALENRDWLFSIYATISGEAPAEEEPKKPIPFGLF